MADAEARRLFEAAIQAVKNKNTHQAEKNLAYATEQWPDQCDLFRARAFNRTFAQSTVISTEEIVSIHRSLDTFDEMVSAIDRSLVEAALSVKWLLPTLGLEMPLINRGQARAAYAAVLIGQGRFDEARAELQTARREKLARPDNATVTAAVISTVESLLYHRTARWTDLLEAAEPLASIAGVDEFNRTLFSAVGDAFIGSALVHLGRHDAGHARFESAIATQLAHPGAFAALEFGLSLRAVDKEELAQKTFAYGAACDLTPELRKAIADPTLTLRVSSAELISSRTDYWNPDTEPDREEFERQSSQGERDELLEKIMAELDALDGMENVKEEVRILAAELEHAAELKKRGIETEPEGRHMVFKGPPGTGKTTVARLIGELFYAKGLIPKKIVKETSRVDFVAGFIGQSAKLTADTVNAAMGGVLFIDEAYSIYEEGASGDNAAFSREAVSELLRLMENHRDELIVIIAGYADRMDEFLRTNPGFRSRFLYELSFETYTPEQMWRIFTGMVAAKGWTVDPAVEPAFTGVVSKLYVRDHRNVALLDELGNGRFARNILTRAMRKATQRMASEGVLSTASTEELRQLKRDDVIAAMSAQLTEQKLPTLVAVATKELDEAS